MVRLAQDFSSAAIRWWMVRVTLVLWMANPPAAYRYTEARMSRMAVEMLTDIEKDTIDWIPT